MTPPTKCGNLARKTLDLVGLRHLEMVDVVFDLAQRAAVRHLRKDGASSTRRIAHEISLLACGVRHALLWDQWAVEADDDERDGFSAAKGALTAAQVGAFIDEVRCAAPEAATLALMWLGPTLFVVRRADLASRLEADAAARLGGLDLLACDETLTEPRPCEPAEREQVVSAMLPIGLELASQLRGAAASDGGAGACCAARHAACGALLVPMHGWLLEYPTLYCHVGGGGAQGGSCLGGTPLSVLRLSARPVGAAVRAAWDRQARLTLDASYQPHLVCSFSLPACDSPLEVPAVARWWAAVGARFEAEGTTQFWCAAKLTAAVVELESVVL